MNVYLVGGAVRDLVMGRPAKDQDYVVVGATVQEMLNAGFKQVGADFPVFLHPETGAEYALARTERKSGIGYHGFTVDASTTVTLEDDLRRRDLTINSMAMGDDHEIIDPYGGLADIKSGILRHTSEAFADDPLRVLRLARFLARFPDFSVHHETLKLCASMVEAGDLGQLTQERVWAELYKALDDSAGIRRFFEFLEQVGALDLVPALTPLSGVSVLELSRVVERVSSHLAGSMFKDVLVGTMLHLSKHVLTESEARGLSADAIKVQSLLALDWYDFRPEQLYDRLVKSGAMRGQWDFIFAALFSEDEQIVELNFQAMQKAFKVTAADFPELAGKELGDAIKRARVRAMSSG